MMIAPPLSLYVHIPWCVQKCPYCDFNSHKLKQDIPEQNYINALLEDLAADIQQFAITRPLMSIFIGGGTPSLLTPDAIKQLLTGIKTQLNFAPNIEVTMEANPGTVEAEKFYGYAEAGVNRLSIGVQSFANDKLIQLGRIHDSEQAQKAIAIAKLAGFNSINIDLMHGLPSQNRQQALEDLKTAIALEPDHLSWYQLTIEPNTEFYSKPPMLPADDELWAIQEAGVQCLTAAGFVQYEISGYAKTDKKCQHNLNYWRFGDYLGIGCGAHGKITAPETNQITRTVKVKHPKGYLDPARSYMDHCALVDTGELTFEFMMNQLRLFSPFTLNDFSERTGICSNDVLPLLKQAEQKQLLSVDGVRWQVTATGHRYLNDLLSLFL